jgi:hypothetical protein
MTCADGSMSILGGVGWCGGLYKLDQGPPVVQYPVGLAGSNAEIFTRHSLATDKKTGELYVCGGSPFWASSEFHGCVKADNPTQTICGRFDAMDQLNVHAVEKSPSELVTGVLGCTFSPDKTQGHMRNS